MPCILDAPEHFRCPTPVIMGRTHDSQAVAADDRRSAVVRERARARRGAAKTPPSNCTITPETFADGNVGTLNTWFVSTTGCSTSKKPVRFKVVDGRIPPGTTLFTQGVSSGGITGGPTTEGVFTFTLQVRDATGTNDTESFSITINPPRPSSSRTRPTSCRPGPSGSSTAAGTSSPTAGCRSTRGRWSPACCRPGWSSRRARGDHGHAHDRRHVRLHGAGHRLARRLRRAHVLDHDQLRSTEAPPSTGMVARNDVPAPGGLATSSEPPSASTRSARQRRPDPSAGSAPPTPSSDTSTSTLASLAPTMRTRAADACAYFATVGQRLRDQVVAGSPAEP